LSSPVNIVVVVVVVVVVDVVVVGGGGSSSLTFFFILSTLLDLSALVSCCHQKLTIKTRRPPTPSVGATLSLSRPVCVSGKKERPSQAAAASRLINPLSGSTEQTLKN
jgi:hypothetical protein